MRLHNAIAVTALLSCSILAYGCSATVTTSPPPPTTGTAPSGCSFDQSVDANCLGGGTGYSCTPGDNPESEDTSLSCSVPEPDSTTGNDDFCCITITFVGSASTCQQVDASITGLMCDFGSYEYQCAGSDDPTSLDASLNCSAGVADQTLANTTDFCCN
jgi:hypothetical protein